MTRASPSTDGKSTVGDRTRPSELRPPRQWRPSRAGTPSGELKRARDADRRAVRAGRRGDADRDAAAVQGREEDARRGADERSDDAVDREVVAREHTED